jgi:gamma-glutamylcyclotransferase (GGCT)/AIG2-like uncharacterized protein YtfP
MGTQPCEASYLATYGTLRRRSRFRYLAVAVSGLEFFGCGLLRGLLLTQRGYPAVLEQPGLVRVEIFRVVDQSIWPVLDDYEGFDATIGKYSLFVRKTVTLVRPQLRVWAYFLGTEIPRGDFIEML